MTKIDVSTLSIGYRGHNLQKLDDIFGWCFEHAGTDWEFIRPYSMYAQNQDQYFLFKDSAIATIFALRWL
jgi:hypothetical protein